MVVAELKMIQMFTGTERGWTGLEMSPSERQLRVRGLADLNMCKVGRVAIKNVDIIELHGSLYNFILWPL